MNSTFIPICFSRYLPSGSNLRCSSVGASSGIAETFRTFCCACAAPETAASIVTNAAWKTKKATRSIDQSILVVEMEPRAYPERTLVQRLECWGEIAVKLFHDDMRAASAHLADDGGVREAFTPEYREHIRYRLGRAGDQQAAARLRIGQQRLFRRREVRSELDVASVGSPVATRSAGHESLRDHGLDARQQRHIAHRQARGK